MKKMTYLLICNDPDMAQYAVGCGVGRIFVDLEILGKDARQGHLSTVISRHQLEDVSRVAAVVPSESLMVRINPLYDGTREEVDEVIARGAGLIMLPMFTSHADVAEVSALINGRAGLIPLIETPSAVSDLAEVVKVNGVTEVYIGLNDLHLALRRSFMFELLADGTVDEMAKIIHAAGLEFGFGGIARVGDGMLPGEMVMAEHVRLGSSRVILSRTFHNQSESLEQLKSSIDLRDEISSLDNVRRGFSAASEQELLDNKVQVKRIVDEIVSARKASAASRSGKG